MNTLRTGILMAALTGLFLAVGALVGGGTGMAIAFALALAINLFAYWNSDKVLLSMYGARQVDAASAPDLYRLVERLAAQARLPMPKVFHHRESAAQRLCHRPQSRTCRGVRHHRLAGAGEPGRAGGRAGA